jgi:ABC-type multidrug transport system ATPase subunit
VQEVELTVRNLSARYARNQKFISQNISFTVRGGEIMAIMGPSGSGKSTLLKALLGTIPKHLREGSIYLNGHDISDTGLACVKHKVGFVPQDDILLNDLTVKENIESFHAIAVDAKESKQELALKINRILEMLNLKTDSKNIENHKINAISGGQRKRVNLAMELINEPNILIIDEPTSGLSSLDSLELISHLKNLVKTNPSVIVIFIIHQPSSDIYRGFDRLLLLNDRGEAIYSGKRQALQSVNSDKERHYDIFPERVMYDIENNNIKKAYDATQTIKAPIDKKPLLRSPWESFKDFVALVKRQFLIKSRDRMSQMITFLAPPLLAFIIAIVFKFAPNNAEYDFITNTLFGQFIYMMIISGMFLGLEGSVTEVIRDRGILERESLRGLSLGSYYFSKLLVLIFFGAIQSLLFVSLSLYILEALDLFIPNLIVMFIAVSISIALGLYVSMLVKTSVSAFKISTMLLIPQIILGGALLPYNSMGKEIYLWEEQNDKMPLVAKVVPASWSYEFAMSLNYEWSEENLDKKNVVLASLTLNPEDTFLSLYRTQSVPFGMLEFFSLEAKQNKTFVYNAWILLGFFLFFVLLGLLTLKKGYVQNKILFTLLQALLTVIFAVLPFLMIKPIDKAAQNNGEFILLKNAMNWFEAQQGCKNMGMTLPSTEQLVDRFNEGRLPESLFWTSEKYRNTSNAYWSVNFAKTNSKNLTLREVASSNTISVAYTTNSVKALVMCVKNDK